MDGFSQVGQKIIDLLPGSPFSGLIASLKKSQIMQYMPYINWIIPVKAMLVVFNTWLIALATYLLLSALLRWAKLIS